MQRNENQADDGAAATSPRQSDRPPVGEPLVVSRRAGGAAPGDRVGGAPGGGGAAAPGGDAGSGGAGGDGETAPELVPTGPLAGRVGLVAGAGGELGAAFAAELVERGARVLLVDDDLDDLRAVAADLPGDDRAVVLRCDVTSGDEVASMADFVRRGGVTVDLVVHATPDGEERDGAHGPGDVLAALERQLAVAVRGPSLLATHLAPALSDAADVVLVGRGPEPVGAGAPARHEVVAGTTRGLADLLRGELLPGDVRVLTAWCDAGADVAAAAVAVLDATAPRDGAAVAELRVAARP